MTKRNYKKTGIKSYFWLLMAVFCIVFSSASKKLIELRVNPASYATYSLFGKRIKDGSRDKRESLKATVVHAGTQSHDNDLSGLFLMTSLISLGLLYFLNNHFRSVIAKEQHLALAGINSIYLRQHRLQV